MAGVAVWVSLLIVSAVQSAERRELTVTANESVEMRFDGHTLWRLNLGSPEGKPYFHPLCAAGDWRTLTDFRPADHRWHLGLWFSWKFLNKANFWEPSNGTTRVVTCGVTTNADRGATATFALRYAVGPREVMTEARTVSIATGTNGLYTMDWDTTFTAGDEAVVIDRTPPGRDKAGKLWTSGGYAGLTWRFPAAPPPALRSADGTEGAEVCGTRAPWAMAGFAPAAGAGGATVLMLDHPGNPGHPTAWFARTGVNSKYHLLGQGVVFHAPLTVPARGTLRLRYRVLVAPATLSPAQAAALWQGYAGS
jgi:hypothetical protein